MGTNSSEPDGVTVPHPHFERSPGLQGGVFRVLTGQARLPVAGRLCPGLEQVAFWSLFPHL